MIIFDEDSLICDLAETYHMFDYRSMPPFLVATLAVGLRDDSRIKLKVSGDKYPLEIILLARLNDLLGFDNNKSILSLLLDEVEEKEFRTFSSAEEYEIERKKILEGR